MIDPRTRNRWIEAAPDAQILLGYTRPFDRLIQAFLDWIGCFCWGYHGRCRAGYINSFDFRCRPRYLEFLSGWLLHIIARPALPECYGFSMQLADSPKR